MQILEKMIYPYPWGTYNVLVLPPSFPWGGMENPVFTFATPSIISHDRQNVNVIAHEFAHSYSGNLVTNASWEHFWLNEGWTRYLERRILAAVHGETYRDFSAIIGWKDLEDVVAAYGDTHEFTKLVPNLKGKDPDDAWSRIPYEKGCAFLTYLEKQVGQDKWDNYARHYFTKFAWRSLDSYEFRADLISFFESDVIAGDGLEKVDWDAWFHSPGLPPKPNFDTSLAGICYALAAKWKHPQVANSEPHIQDIEGMDGNQISVFLNTILNFPKPLHKLMFRKMSSIYGFAESKNVEILKRYLQIGLRARDELIYRPVTDFLGTTGRIYDVRPLYRLLNEIDRTMAVETYERHKEFYHPNCRDGVEKDLFGAEASWN